MKFHVGHEVFWRSFAVLLVGAWLAAGGQAQEGGGGEAPSVGASAAVDPGGEAGRAALSALSKRKSAAYAQEGDARREALRDVARRYVELSASQAHRAAERAEAAFRGGELYRSTKAVDAARAAFESAAALGVGNEGEVFAARAWLELGHIARRADDLARAAELYTVVTDRFASHERPAAHAWTWRSKVAVAQEAFDDASIAVRGFLERFAETYPVEGIRNAERLVRALEATGGHDSDALALKGHVEAVIEAARPSWADDSEAVDEALGELGVTSPEETR